MNTTYLSCTQPRRPVILLLVLLCEASHCIADASTIANYVARVVAADTMRGRPHRLVLTLDASRMDSVVTHSHYAGFAESASGQIVRGLEVPPSMPRSTGAVPFPIAWEKRTEVERAVRNFKQSGLPIVHLWGSGRSSLALGVSPKRVPGIYFTQAIPH